MTILWNLFPPHQNKVRFFLYSFCKKSIAKSLRYQIDSLDSRIFSPASFEKEGFFWRDFQIHGNFFLKWIPVRKMRAQKLKNSGKNWTGFCFGLWLLITRSKAVNKRKLDLKVSGKRTIDANWISNLSKKPSNDKQPISWARKRLILLLFIGRFLLVPIEFFPLSAFLKKGTSGKLPPMWYQNQHQLKYNSRCSGSSNFTYNFITNSMFNRLTFVNANKKVE